MYRSILLLTNVTSERDAKGEALWFGGPGTDTGGKVRGAQSYYCVYGKSPAEEAAAKPIKTIDTRDASVTCGRYETWTSITGPTELVSDGFWHNLPLGETMKNIRVEAPCGICVVFR
jgi:hypothetical protein